MAVVEPRASFLDWIPVTHSNFDSKEAKFHIPISLLPITRQIFFKRHACDTGQRDSAMLTGLISPEQIGGLTRTV